MVLTSNRDGAWKDDWDAEVHTSHENAIAELPAAEEMCGTENVKLAVLFDVDVITRIEQLCDWLNPAFDTHYITHEGFHFGSPCPYQEVVPAMLRGESDPRRKQ
jgi:hypothetical protein